MWHYPDLDPIAVGLGPISIYWYAISYLAAIGLAWWTMGIRNRQHKLGWSDDDIADIVFYGVLGILLGGRLGYMFFYGFDSLLANPLSLFKIWQGGMSFHGGLIGVLVAIAVFAKRKGSTFFTLTDFIAPSIPLGIGCGRIGNFINTELPGRITEVPWAVIYPGESVGRHPSSLYQAVLEGVVLFAIVWMFAAKPRPKMAVSGVFLLGYGSLRIFSEFFRTPDSHIGFVMFNWITQGQLLSLPMVLLGIFFITYSYSKANK